MVDGTLLELVSEFKSGVVLMGSNVIGRCFAGAMKSLVNALVLKLSVQICPLYSMVVRQCYGVLLGISRMDRVTNILAR